MLAEPIHLFPLKGFYFGIAARKLGLHALNTPKPKSSKRTSTKSSSSKDAPMPEIVVGEPTLEQTRVDADKVAVNSVNQLDRAAQTYNNLQNMHKAFLATSVLSHTADYHSNQAKCLRNIDGNRTWELGQLNGECHKHVRLTIAQVAFTRNYTSCGIEQNWRPLTIDINDPRISYSNGQSKLLWAMCFASAREWEHRNLAYQAGPRRQTLLTDPSEHVRNAYIHEFAKDTTNHDTLADIKEEWAEAFQNRSIFKRLNVIQLRRCLDVEDWIATERHLKKQFRNYSYIISYNVTNISQYTQQHIVGPNTLHFKNKHKYIGTHNK